MSSYSWEVYGIYQEQRNKNKTNIKRRDKAQKGTQQLHMGNWK